MRCVFEDAVASWRCLRVKVVVPLATNKTMVVITINPSHGIAGHARAAARSHFPPHHSPAHRNKRQAKQGRVITASVTMIMLYARQQPHLAYNVASTTSIICLTSSSSQNILEDGCGIHIRPVIRSMRWERWRKHDRRTSLFVFEIQVGNGRRWLAWHRTQSRT